MTFASKMMQISTINDLRKKFVFVTFFKYNMYPVNENILGISFHLSQLYILHIIYAFLLKIGVEIIT